MAAQPTIDRLQGLFRDSLRIDVPSPETDLIDSGLIDSLTLVDLLFALEREFGVTLPFDQLEIDSFRNLTRIEELVSHANGSQPSI